jgi:integrase
VRGCNRAKVKVWTPNRLRHSVGTRVRAKYGAEAAKTVLGHRFLNTTEIYAEKDRQKYISIMRKRG